MHIERLSLLDGARRARGLAVVIDVFRAFSTAAYAFAGGAREIALVAGVDEAFALRARWPDALLMGEHENGARVPGFDFGNSPSAIAQADVRGRRLIHRTSAGTRGVVAASGAGTILLGSLVVAGAVVRVIRAAAPDVVALVAMGNLGERPAVEDEACADLLEARLAGHALDEAALVQRIATSDAVDRFAIDSVDVPRADVDCCLRIDAFPFAMRVHHRDGVFVAAREIVH